MGDLEALFGPRIFGYARWRKYWLKVFCELTQDRRTRVTFVRDVVNLPRVNVDTSTSK